MSSKILPIEGQFWLSNDLQKTYRSFHGREFPLEALFFIMIILSGYAIMTTFVLTYDSEKKSTALMKGLLFCGATCDNRGLGVCIFQVLGKTCKDANSEICTR
jgi:hypothetical protein